MAGHSPSKRGVNALMSTAIHALLLNRPTRKRWMPATSAGVTLG